MNRRDAETQRENIFTEKIIGCAIEAHLHEAQLLSDLKLSGHSVGLLMNFYVPVLKSGIKRIVNNFQESSASPRLSGDPKSERKLQ